MIWTHKIVKSCGSALAMWSVGLDPRTIEGMSGSVVVMGAVTESELVDTEQLASH